MIAGFRWASTRCLYCSSTSQKRRQMLEITGKKEQHCPKRNGHLRAGNPLISRERVFRFGQPRRPPTGDHPQGGQPARIDPNRIM